MQYTCTFQVWWGDSSILSTPNQFAKQCQCERQNIFWTYNHCSYCCCCVPCQIKCFWYLKYSWFPGKVTKNCFEQENIKISVHAIHQSFPGMVVRLLNTVHPQRVCQAVPVWKTKHLQDSQPLFLLLWCSLSDQMFLISKIFPLSIGICWLKSQIKLKIGKNWTSV